MNVRIEMNKRYKLNHNRVQNGRAYVIQSNKKYKKKKPLLAIHDNRQQHNLSRLIDVRLWNQTEIKEFLRVCVDGKYFQIFIRHNLNGKRLEYITCELFTYCNIHHNDA